MILEILDTFATPDRVYGRGEVWIFDPQDKSYLELLACKRAKPVQGIDWQHFDAGLLAEAMADQKQNAFCF